jgi:exonuclease 3'-5' domain-containing protein 1
MLIVLAQTNIVVVNSITTLLSLLNNIISLIVDPPSLYLDLKGVKLGCYNSISIISLYIAPIKKIYLIDIYYISVSGEPTI